MKTAVLTLSAKGLVVAQKICDGIPGAKLYAHSAAGEAPDAEPFERVVELTAEIFRDYEGLVYVMPCGVVVRAIAAHVDHKKQDPAVVVADVGGRHAVSLLSGHEGGANGLAMRVANIIGAEPVISTTTEAEKNIIVGVGCRKGTSAERIREAVTAALEECGERIENVRLIATADVKRDEKGLIDAAEAFGIPLRIIDSATIKAFGGAFESSDYVKEKVGLPAVAEPCAMLAGRRTELLLNKRKYNGITVAAARENCLWSE